VTEATTHNGALDPRGSLPDRDGPAEERRRSLASLGVAIFVHAGVIAVLAVTLGAFGGYPILPPVTIELQGSLRGGEAAGSAAGGGSSPAAAVLSPSPGPVAAVPAAPAAGAGPASGSSDFVIPTPRSPSASTAPAASGPAFRESGGRTGVTQGVPSTPSPVPGPAVAPVQQGTSGSGSGSASGASASSEQRSGTGVLVGGSGQSSAGALDLGKLDKALASAGSAGSAAGRGGSTGTGGSGSASGSGSGSGGGSGGSATGPYSVEWGTPDAGKGRWLVFTVTPKLPSWVEREGLPLSVKVSFSVLADGVVTGASIQRSSGYADVDAAVVDAIRLWLFNSVPNGALVRGIIPYVIRPE